MAILATTSGTPIIGWVATILGWIMNLIYLLISTIGLPNVGLAIILFTIVIYLAMTPLQIQQQRFSKLNAVMQPELQKIQEKYKGKKDQASQQKQIDETNAVYAKYGVSPTGSCAQLLIQMPVLFALYQVIYRIPGYITIIGTELRKVAEDSAFVTFFKSFVEGNGNKMLSNYLTAEPTTENVMDTVYRLNSTEWAGVLSQAKGMSFESTLTELHSYIHRATSFLGLNISDSPSNILRTAWEGKNFILIFAAILIPVLAWFTQWINFKMMPQPERDPRREESSMEASMRSMNNFMPIMSAVFCFTLPVGMGIYWIAGAVVRAIQQYVINKKINSESIDEIIAKSVEKANKKRAKKGLPPQKITNSAHVSTRSLETEQKLAEERAEARARAAKAHVEDSTAYYNQNAKPGSLASKANMVKAYDERIESGKKNKKK